MRPYLVLALVLSTAAFLITRADPPAPSLQTSFPINRLAKLPLYFVENQGQTSTAADYYIQGRHTSVYFSPNAITYVLTKPEPASRSPFRNASLEIPQAPTRAAVSLELLDANPNARIEPLQRTEANFSYFRGSPGQWHTAVPAYATLLYRDVWPGIDIEFTGPEGNLKYTFHVQPGADPSRIRFAYRGATRVALAPQGHLEIETPAGGFSDDKPVAWQDHPQGRKPVHAAFSLRDDEVRFTVGAFDRSRGLFIDPVILLWSGFLGEASFNENGSIAVDAAGYVYITGSVPSTNLFTAVGPDTTHNGGLDAFVTKVNSAGTEVVYSGFLGGSSFEVGSGIAVDGTGNAYVTGLTDSLNFPTTLGGVGGLGTTHNGGLDAFVTKVNSTGTALVYSGLLGGSGWDVGSGIAIDAAGNAYITGWASSPNFPTTVGPDTTHNGSYDAFVAKINSSGTALVYSGFLGGAVDDYGYGIAVDGAGNAYVTGKTSSPNFPTTVGPDTTHNGGFNDAFVVKVNLLGTALVYSGFLGGASSDYGYGIAVDGAGNAYVTGETSSPNFPTTVGPDTTHNGAADAFVTKVNSAGSALVYSGFLGGSAADLGYGIAVDAAGNAYVTGRTDSLNFPTTVGPDTTHNGAADAFVTKVNSAGTVLVYSGFLGGSGADVARGIAVDGAGNAYVTGSTESAGFPTTGPSLPAQRSSFVTALGAFPSTAGPTVAFRNGFNAIETLTFPAPAARNSGGSFRFNPAVAASPSGRFFIASRDSSGGIWLNYVKTDNTYNGWVFAGGNSPGNPDLAASLQNTAVMVIRDPWNSYWVQFYSANSGVLSGWLWLQGIFATEPRIAGCPNGDLWVAGRDNWDGVWVRRFIRAGPAWDSWLFIGGQISGSPAITCGADNAAYIAARGREPNDKSMWLARVSGNTFSWHWGQGIYDVESNIQPVANGNLIHVVGLSASVPVIRTWNINLAAFGGWVGWTYPGGILTQVAPAVYGSNLFLTGQATNGDLWWWSGLSNSWRPFGPRNIAAGSRLSAGAK